MDRQGGGRLGDRGARGEMMKRHKKFDCVEMKNSIQVQLRKEQAGLTDQEIRERSLKILETSDDLVARKWRRLKQLKASKPHKDNAF